MKQEFCHIFVSRNKTSLHSARASWKIRTRVKKLLFFILVTTFSALAQQGDRDDFYVRGAYNFGFILQHHNNMGQLVNGFINGFELNYIKPTSGDHLWHYENNFPERGVGFTYFNLDNPTQLGNLYAVYAFYEIPLKEIPKPFRLHMRLAPGFSYTPIYFDPINNHKNNVISSPISAYINFKWFFEWNINKHLRFEAGLNFSHASNGRSTVPNLGVNMVTLNSGFVYKFLSAEKHPVTLVDSSSKRVSRNELLAWFTLGENQVEVLGKKYIAQNYSLSWYHNIRNTHKLGAGLEVGYNPANLHFLQADSLSMHSNLENTQIGIKIAYSYNAGRLSFPVEMGYYVYSKYTDDGSFFHRIGMRYYLKNNFVLIASLKTHWAVANFFEFGAGYRIPIKK